MIVLADNTPTHESELEAFAAGFGEFMRATRRARGRRLAAEPAAESALTLAQFHLLDQLLDSDAPLMVRELALGAGVTAPTATRMLAGLERDGLVARERPAQGDQRCVLIRLTDEGRGQLRSRRARVTQWRRTLFESLAPEQRTQAARLLRQLAQAVDEL